MAFIKLFKKTGLLRYSQERLLLSIVGLRSEARGNRRQRYRNHYAMLLILLDI